VPGLRDGGILTTIGGGTRVRARGGRRGKMVAGFGRRILQNVRGGRRRGKDLAPSPHIASHRLPSGEGARALLDPLPSFPHLTNPGRSTSLPTQPSTMMLEVDVSVSMCIRIRLNPQNATASLGARLSPSAMQFPLTPPILQPLDSITPHVLPPILLGR